MENCKSVNAIQLNALSLVPTLKMILFSWQLPECLGYFKLAAFQNCDAWISFLALEMLVNASLFFQIFFNWLICFSLLCLLQQIQIFAWISMQSTFTDQPRIALNVLGSSRATVIFLTPTNVTFCGLATLCIVIIRCWFYNFGINFGWDIVAQCALFSA